MGKQTINIGTTAGDGTGDPVRVAFDISNSNFNELYAGVTGLTTSSSTSFTPDIDDAGHAVLITNSSSITFTVPNDSSVDYDNSTVISVIQGGIGQITIIGDGGVTVNSYNSGNKTAGQYAALSLIKIATNNWIVIGGIE